MSKQTRTSTFKFDEDEVRFVLDPTHKDFQWCEVTEEKVLQTVIFIIKYVMLNE